MLHRPYLLAALAVPLLIAVPARADRGVFLNGVRADSVRDQTFSNATVRIDSVGNVHITAPGVKVRRIPQGPPETAADLVHRYWLISSKSKPGATRYAIDVFLNGRYVRRVLSPGPHVTLDVTEYLKPGKNVVKLTARKDTSLPPISNSPADFLKLLLGPGRRVGEQLVIDTTLVEYRRHAGETKPFEDRFEFEVE